MEQRSETIIYGTPSGASTILDELKEWCDEKGYTIRKGMNWNVVVTPSYTGADGKLKEGREDKCVTQTIDGDGNVVDGTV